MGVMSCYRKGCEGIMCHTYVPEIGYICSECQIEFKEYLKSVEKRELTEGEMMRELENFMVTRKGSYTQGNTLTVEEFLNRLQVETRERQLENALNVAMTALGTYGTHPIIQSQARKALKKKDGSMNIYTEDEVVELFHKLEEARSSYTAEDVSDILPLEQFFEEENIKG